tara:strand:- start:156 stop:371 length:216 start_codon:yes stop_codon:yes gene_type:complete
MHWNHRIVWSTDTKEFGLHEVYYNEDQTIIGCTQKPVSVTGENISDLKWLVEHLKKALKRGVIDGETLEEL